MEDLLRRDLEAAGRAGKPAPAFSIDPDRGLPVVTSPRPVTSDDVKSLEDEM